MEGENPTGPQHWTAKRRMALVFSILKGDTSVAQAAERHGLTVAEVEAWRERFLLGAENALRSPSPDDSEMQREQLHRLKRQVADLVLEVDVLREASIERPAGPKKPDL